MRRTLGFLLMVWQMTAAGIPAGTPLSVRLQTPVSTEHSKPGDPIAGILISPAGVLPVGLEIKGTVEQSQKRAGKDRRAVLELRFSEVAGIRSPLQAKVVDVDNARESVDEEGIIHGIVPLRTRPTKIEMLLLLAAHAHPIFLAAAEATKLAMSREARPEIAYGAGVELTLQLTAPLGLDGPIPASPGLYASEAAPDAALERFTGSLPPRTVAGKPHKPSDLTNLVFLGTHDDLHAAFLEAGWTPALAASLRTDTKTFFAIAERHAYAEAPVSTLLLDGRKPDLVFQKQNNTFAKRHHIRIWRQPETFQDRSVWLGAATHDIGIVFSREARTFTHRVDSQIDRERAKVVEDLNFTQCVSSIAYVDRANVPRQDQNATGDRLETDGRIAVLWLRATPAAKSELGPR